MMALGMLNTFILSCVPANTSYAESNVSKIIDIKEFEDIRDIVVAKEDEVAIIDKPGNGYNLIGALEPGEYLKLVADCENYYEVLYKGKLAYVNKIQYVGCRSCENRNAPINDIILLAMNQ